MTMSQVEATSGIENARISHNATETELFCHCLNGI